MTNVQSAELARLDAASPAKSNRNGENDRADYDVLIVGAGFSGVYQLYNLRKRGFKVRLLEAAPDIGGIWYWNCYPGARVDTQVPIYEFSDENLWKDWNWKELFPGWEELRNYFDYVDSKWHIRKDIEFNARVTSADFDEAGNQWTVRTRSGDQFRSRYVILCTGFAAKAYIPAIEGLDSFAGPKPHTGLWPQEGLDFAGKRVGVIGTGASAVQVIQEAAKTASHVTVFQRTMNMALPMGPRHTDVSAQSRMKADYPARFDLRRKTFGGFDMDFLPKGALEVSPEERQEIYEAVWAKAGFHPWLATFNDVLFNKEANDTAYAFWRDKTRARINDPDIARKLAPDTAPYPFGTKRPCLENGYYEVFNQDNVTLVDLRENAIHHVTPNAVVTADGIERELDILVMGTGFDAVTGGILSIDIRGVDGSTINERWKDGIRANLGLATAGFPNLLFVYGPHAPTGFLNGPTAAEAQGDVVIQLLDYLRANDYARIESTKGADEAWAEHVSDVASKTLFVQTNSWYMGANIPGKKREMLNYPGGLPLYLQKCDETAQKGYEGFVLSRATVGSIEPEVA
ncbi:NAD(P)/FAD-dependent oxidoreductase [Paraburkholderia sp. J67]|uniref:flavin-containing monooxygenase n=1 Tax=Paraburkholderia sp. J67 TaxID=2805435 RepID=UPI002ABD64D1|nr:NAD(P)/FAD-dependent oxidoreductase [Paraburkholderia sp. J67]